MCVIRAGVQRGVAIAAAPRLAAPAGTAPKQATPRRTAPGLAHSRQPVPREASTGRDVAKMTGAVTDGARPAQGRAWFRRPGPGRLDGRRRSVCLTVNGPVSNVAIDGAPSNYRRPAAGITNRGTASDGRIRNETISDMAGSGTTGGAYHFQGVGWMRLPNGNTSAREDAHCGRLRRTACWRFRDHEDT